MVVMQKRPRPSDMIAYRKIGEGNLYQCALTNQIVFIPPPDKTKKTGSDIRL